MQCPNCGKEALNINGRMICLDCGIEVAHTAPPNSFVDESQEINAPSQEESKQVEGQLAPEEVMPIPQSSFASVQSGPATSLQDENGPVELELKESFASNGSAPTTLIPGNGVEVTAMENPSEAQKAISSEELLSTMQEFQTNVMDGSPVGNGGITTENPQDLREDLLLNAKNHPSQKPVSSEQLSVDQLSDRTEVISGETPGLSANVDGGKEEFDKSSADEGEKIGITVGEAKAEVPNLDFQGPSTGVFGNIDSKPLSELSRGSEEGVDLSLAAQGVNGLPEEPITSTQGNILGSVGDQSQVPFDTISLGSIGNVNNLPQNSANADLINIGNSSAMDFMPVSGSMRAEKFGKKFFIIIIVLGIILAIGGVAYFFKDVILDTITIYTEDVPVKVFE